MPISVSLSIKIRFSITLPEDSDRLVLLCHWIHTLGLLHTESWRTPTHPERETFHVFIVFLCNTEGDTKAREVCVSVCVDQAADGDL